MSKSATVRSAAPALVLVLALSGALGAQASFSEGFDAVGPANWGQLGHQGLLDDGWIFRNQSSPAAVALPWYDAAAFASVAPHFEGASHLETSSQTAPTMQSGAISNWAILPAIPGQQAGDLISFWVRGISFCGAHFLQVRYSPSGGTSTGSGPTAVGDFTEVILDLAPALNQWQQAEGTIPGGGRLAIRYGGALIQNWPCGGTVLGIDSLTIGGAPPAPCNLPLPQPGETVTWSGAAPLSVCLDLTIPAGGTVILAPGTTLLLEPGTTLSVQGELRAAGTVGAPVSIQGPADAAIVVHGTFESDFATLAAPLRQGTGSRIRIADSTVAAGAPLSVAIPVDGPMLTVIERSVVMPPDFAIVGQFALRDVTYQGSRLFAAGYGVIDGFDSAGGTLHLWREVQPMRVDGVTIAGAAGAALVLDGGVDYLVGPDFAAAGSGYPVEIRGAGLLPGSVLPAAGNAENVILGPAGGQPHGGSYHWPDLGLPYHFLESPVIDGPVSADPGITVRLGPGGGIGLRSNLLHHGHRLSGRPGSPIVLERLDPAARWGVLSGIGGANIFRYLDIDGADLGVASVGGESFVEECAISQCAIGIKPSVFGDLIVRGTELLGNDEGAQSDVTGIATTGLDLSGGARSNIFAGNLLAVNNITTTGPIVPAEENWWGDASGPFHAVVHPGGQGDAISSGVDALPFRTALPDLSDSPPWIELSRPFIAALPGDVVFLRWEAGDDAAIVEQFVTLDASGGGNHDYQPVATLPGDARTFQWTVPNVGSNVFARPALLRIEAVDAAGNRSFDQVPVQIPPAAPAGSVAILTDLSAGFLPGEKVQLCWDAVGVANSPVQSWLLLEGDERRYRGPEGPAGNACGYADLIIPSVSTDCARIAIVADPNTNIEEWYYSEPFSIRPDPALGDAPPQVSLVSPLPGASFANGGIVPVSWTASDDEGLTSFAVQVSTNGGDTWNTLASDLPGTALGWDWQTPGGSAIPEVRLRVIARDHRLQISSAGADFAFALTDGSADADADGIADALDNCPSTSNPGQEDADGDGIGDACESAPGFLRGDVSGDGNRNIADAVVILNALFGPGSIPCADAADANDDGALNISDPIALLAHLFVAGAPSIPAPSVYCGDDPTPDPSGELGCAIPPICD